jgi:hypothetical protein
VSYDKIILFSFIVLPGLYFLAPATAGAIAPREGQMIALMFACVLAASFWHRSRIVVAFFSMLILWQAYAMTASLVIQTPESIMFFLQVRPVLMACFLGGLVVIAISRGNIKEETIQNFICVAVLLQSVIAVPQYWGFYAIESLMSLAGIPVIMEGVMVVGMGMECSNYFAAFLSIGLPFFFRSGWIWFVPLVAGHLLMSGTTTAVVAACVAGGVYYGRLWIIGALGVVGLAFAVSDGSVLSFAEGSRYGMWWEAGKALAASPVAILIGNGPGTASALVNSHLHNEWLQVLYETGLFGLSLAVAYAVRIWGLAGKHTQAALAAAFVDMIGNHALHLPPTAMMICILAGMAERNQKERDNGIGIPAKFAEVFRRR